MQNTVRMAFDCRSNGVFFLIRFTYLLQYVNENPICFIFDACAKFSSLFVLDYFCSPKVASGFELRRIWFCRLYTPFSPVPACLFTLRQCVNNDDMATYSVTPMGRRSLSGTAAMHALSLRGAAGDVGVSRSGAHLSARNVCMSIEREILTSQSFDCTNQCRPRSDGLRRYIILTLP